MRWTLFFAAVFPVVAIWSLTNPMFASPDEMLHMIRAQGFARLDFGDLVETDGLPEKLPCFAFQPEVPATCQDLTWGADGRLVEFRMDGYPPLFHAVASLPSVVSSGLDGAYLMRLWLGTLCSGLAAWAGAILVGRAASRWYLAGYVFAVTPMMVFTMATVSPSGLASVGALLFVSSCLAWQRDGTSRAVLVGLGVGAGLLALSRRDGVIWLSLLSVALAPLLSWHTIGDAVRRWPPGRWRIMVPSTLGLLAVAVIVARPTVSRFYSNWRGGLGTWWWEAARYVRTYLVQAVGVFGWLDSPLGEEGFLLVMMGAGAIAMTALAGRSRKLVISTILGVALLCATPVLFGVMRFPYLQGRYLLPIWIATLLLAGASAARAELPTRADRRMVGVLLGVWVLVQGIGLVQNLRRYAVGRSGPWGDLLDETAWHPPKVPNAVALSMIGLALAVAGVALYAVFTSATDAGRSDLFGEPPRHAVEDRPAHGEGGE